MDEARGGMEGAEGDEAADDDDVEATDGDGADQLREKSVSVSRTEEAGVAVLVVVVVVAVVLMAVMESVRATGGWRACGDGCSMDEWD